MQKKALNVNIQTSHTEQCKYLANASKSNEDIIGRLEKRDK